MPLSRNNIPSSDSKAEKITLLWVTGSHEDQNVLHQFFANARWQIRVASSLREARNVLSECNISVVLCERTLDDGHWQTVLDMTAGRETAPPVVVISRTADPELWAEVLNLGGYDVLLRPFDKSEVLRVVGMAWRQHQSALQRCEREALVH